MQAFQPTADDHNRVVNDSTKLEDSKDNELKLCENIINNQEKDKVSDFPHITITASC